nr:hypothetical protein [Tanacetum cinerariifolium]
MLARECQKLKKAKDAAYHREKMLLCKQEEARIQLNAEQADWRDDTDDDELDDQELEAHYIYMAQLQEVSPDAANSGPIFDGEPVEEIDQNDDDNDLAKERQLLASLIEKLKCEIDESKNRNKFLEPSNKKEAQIKLYKTREDKELDKVIELENKVKVLDNIVYKIAPDSDEVIRLEKESRSKLSDLIRPFDYDKLNNLYDLFVPQREKSFEQRYFSERSRLSHINVNNGKSIEAFNKQTTLLEKRMDESIQLDKQYQSSIEIFKVKTSQLETQKTQFLNEIDRLSKEYYYVDRMNAILGVYTELDENVSQEIRDQLNAEAEAVQIILTGIDNDSYSIVDACPNVCEMWKAIERLKQGESINVQDLETNLYWEFRNSHLRMVNPWNRITQEWQRFVTLVKQSQKLKTISYHKLYDILKQHQHEVNEIRAERITHIANLLALVAKKQLVYHPQTHPTHYTQNSSTRSQQAATRNKGKEIINSPQPIYDQEPSMVAKDNETSNDKEIDKLMALISLSFKKIYKPTNNNLRTSSNTSRANQNNSPRINRSAGYENQRIGNVAGARETVASKCQKPKRAKDAAYHREKMLLCKQEEAGIQLNAEQADWRDDTDDELEDQELEAHYITHPEQSKSVHDTYPIEHDLQNVIIDSLDMSYNREEIDQKDDDNDLAKERELLASLIEKLKCEIDERKNRNKFLETSNKKEAQIKIYKTREDKELDKVIELEHKVKVLDNIVYKTNQSVQTMNMLNNKCRTSFAKPEFLKKAQRENPYMYDI